MLPQSGHSQASAAGTCARGLPGPHLHFQSQRPHAAAGTTCPCCGTSAGLPSGWPPFLEASRGSPGHKGRPPPARLPGQQHLHPQCQSSQTKTQDEALGDGQCGRSQRPRFVSEVPRPPDTRPRHCHGVTAWGWAGSSSAVSPRLWLGALGDRQIGAALPGVLPGPAAGVWDGVRGKAQGSHVTAPPAPASM